MYPTHRAARYFVLSAVLTALAAVPAAAQSHRGAITLTGGGSVHSDLAPGLSESAVFQPGWITGLQLERWLGSGRVGLRLNTLWAQRELDRTGPNAYNVFVGGTDLMIRLRQPRAGTAFAPFIAFGAGATYYADLASTSPLGGGAYGDPVFRAHIMPSVGFDLLSSDRSALRLEVGDQIVLPSVGYSPPTEGVPMVHNLVVTLGLQVRMGHIDGRSVRMAESRPTPAPAAARPAAEDRSAIEDRLAAKDREIARLRARVDSLERLVGADEGATATSGPEPAARAASAADARFTVQVGSFVEAATADRWVQRLRDRGFPVWRSDVEIEGERVSRVRVGALASESEAHTLADVLRGDYGWPVWVDRVRDDEAVPADAVDRTRSVLYRL